MHYIFKVALGGAWHSNHGNALYIRPPRLLREWNSQSCCRHFAIPAVKKIHFLGLSANCCKTWRITSWPFILKLKIKEQIHILRANLPPGGDCHPISHKILFNVICDNGNTCAQLWLWRHHSEHVFRNLHETSFLTQSLLVISVTLLINQSQIRPGFGILFNLIEMRKGQICFSWIAHALV